VTARHWTLLAAGLLTWAALVVLWAATPSVCTLPETAGSPHCRAGR
jgi:hypothetical protein